MLNSEGDNLFISEAGDVDSVVVESADSGAGLSRPVPRSESDPLPLWLASVVMNLIGWSAPAEWSAELQAMIIARSESHWSVIIRK